MKKITAILGASVVGLLLGASVSAYADHGRDDDHHGGPQYHHDDHRGGGPQGHARNDHDRPSPQPRVEYHRSGPEHRVARPPERHEVEHRPDFHNPHYRPVDNHGPQYRHEPPRPPVRDVWARERAHHWEREHRSWHQRGGYVGYRIPDRQFHDHFGRGHWFRVHSVPMVVVEGRPRFQYSGLWFSVIDPWPETWAANWYETDDVYVDYVNDGYYLCNRSHPGVHIAINVSL